MQNYKLLTAYQQTVISGLKVLNIVFLNYTVSEEILAKLLITRNSLQRGSVAHLHSSFMTSEYTRYIFKISMVINIRQSQIGKNTLNFGKKDVLFTFGMGPNIGPNYRGSIGLR